MIRPAVASLSRPPARRPSLIYTSLQREDERRKEKERDLNEGGRGLLPLLSACHLPLASKLVCFCPRSTGERGGCCWSGIRSGHGTELAPNPFGSIPRLRGTLLISSRESIALLKVTSRDQLAAKEFWNRQNSVSTSHLS